MYDSSLPTITSIQIQHPDWLRTIRFSRARWNYGMTRSRLIRAKTSTSTTKQVQQYKYLSLQWNKQGIFRRKVQIGCSNSRARTDLKVHNTWNNTDARKSLKLPRAGTDLKVQSTWDNQTQSLGEPIPPKIKTKCYWYHWQTRPCVIMCRVKSQTQFHFCFFLQGIHAIRRIK